MPGKPWTDLHVDNLKRDLAAGKSVLVVAHGNSLRALVKHLDGINDVAIAELNIPTGIPLLYELDESFKPVAPGGRYLDPEAAVAAAVNLLPLARRSSIRVTPTTRDRWTPPFRRMSRQDAPSPTSSMD